MECWCGNTKLVQFGEGYQRCEACETLVAAWDTKGFNPRVGEESKSFYGKDYWFGHQTVDLECPDIVSRSRSDLAERCVHWVKSLLEFKLPPAKVLEIGCAHGGFVAMLRQAGFDAMGLELSPSIVRMATDTFRVPVLTGPVEDQNIAGQSLDAIVMMDVLEHLPNAVGTISRCMELLKPDGILMVQTPEYPEGKSLRQMEFEGHQFPRMLDQNEHFFLYSRTAAIELVRRAGGEYVEFIPAVFDFYDMCFVASGSQRRRNSAEQVAGALSRTVSGRFIQALIDLDNRRLNLLGKYRELRKATPDNLSRAGLKSADVA